MPGPDNLDDIDPNGALPEMPADPAPAYIHDWWTWNMALAWIAFRSRAVVDRIGSHHDDAYALGTLLTDSLGERDPKIDVDLASAWASADGKGEQSSLIDAAERHLIDAVRARKIRVTGTKGNDQGKPVTIPTSELAFLDYRPWGSSDEGVLSRVATEVAQPASEDPVDTPHSPIQYRQPRLRRGDIVKLFEPHGKSVGSNRQANAATQWLAEHLEEAEGTPIKVNCRLKVREAGYEITNNQFTERVWPDAVTRSGRPDLRNPGRRPEGDDDR